ncbi:MAG: conjugal transfer protein TraD [Caulobacteraceae bacterium]
MRKPRDFDAELKALADKTRALKGRRVRQLGELILATGADALDAELLAGVLLQAAEMKDNAVKEGWRRRGAGWFLGKGRGAAQGSRNHKEGPLPLFDGSPSDRNGQGQD